MQKLFKLLTAFSLTIILPTNIIACGNEPNITPTDPKDITTLLKEAETKVNALLANLTSENKNLLKPGIFEEEDSGPLLTNINASGSNKNIDDINITNPLFTFIQEIISDFGQKLNDDSYLKQLFYGINVNEILKFNLEDSTIFKHTFDDWQNDNYFFDGYEKTDYDIQSWNYLSANLSLILKYKNNDNQTLEMEIKPNFDFYFSNQQAKIDKIIDLLTNNNIKKLENYLVEVTGPKKYYISTFHPTYLYLLQNDIVKNITNYLNDENIKIISTKLVNEESMANNSNKYKFYKNDNEEKMTTGIINDEKIQEQTFAMELDTWEGKSLIPADKIANVSFFGELELLNWKYKDITLKSQKVKTALIENETRTKKMQTTAEKLAKLCNLQEGLLKNKITFDNQSSYINVTMNATDFDNYVKNGNTFVDVMNLYVQEKLKTLAKNAGIIDDNDFFIAKLWFPTQRLSKTAINERLNSEKTKATYEENNTPSIGNNICFIINNYYLSNSSSTEIRWTVIKGENDAIWPI